MAAVCASLFLSSCAELPAIGPTMGEVEGNGSAQSSDPFVIIEVDDNVVRTLGGLKPVGFAGHLESTAPKPELKISVGDTLQINIIEQAPGGLFTSPIPPAAVAAQTLGNGLAAAPATMQTVQVEADGSITVPFAGRIVAAGRTTNAVRTEIEHKLESKAIFPQVHVLIVNPTGNVSGNSSSIGGEVNRPGLIPLLPSGNRMLDLIAEAGGARFPAYETTVYLTRRGQRHEVSLQTLVDHPRENVFIYPHDDIYLSHYQRTFTVLGASSKVGRYAFETARVNLAEAVAIAGGFIDASANPAGVYIFRYEPSSLVRAMNPGLALVPEALTPVLYRVNLRGGNGYFLSTKFDIHDKDVVLLANSDAAQFQKFLNIIQSGANFVLTTKILAQQNPVSTSISTSTPSK